MNGSLIKLYTPPDRDLSIEKPPISEIVGRYTTLRRCGREYVALCPFHSEKTASFFVNEDKGTFYCHGCHEGGDVIRFIERVESLSFKEVLSHLGLDNQPKPTRAEITKRENLRRASRNLADWALAIDQRVGVKLRQLGQWMSLATDKRLREEMEREWIILTTLEQDLSDPDLVLSLWQQRKAIERLVGNDSAYTSEELESLHPPLTDSYKQRLISYVRGEA